MRKEDKGTIIAQIAETVKEYSCFYLAETATLNAEKTSNLRRACYSPLYGSLKGSTTMFFANVGNAPAKLIKEFRKTSEDLVLKAAYVEEGFYIGADQLDALVAIKSKNELIAEVIALLQSPAKNVVSALQSSGSTLHGVLQTLSER